MSAREARHYADLYPLWAAHADRQGDLLFLRFGHDFITFGEHATIVAALTSESAHTTDAGGNPIGPIFCLSGLELAEAAMRDMLRGGHRVAIAENANPSALYIMEARP
jgi:hypothetical protein